MEDFEKEIRQHNIDRQLRIGSQFDSFSKGQAAQEGEIRTHGGVKVKKVGNKWIPVSGEKKGPTKAKDPSPRKRKQEEETTPNKEESPIQNINRHEKAKLSTIKTFYKKDPVGAYELAESLSDEAKNVIPQKVWDEMSKAAMEHKKEAEQKEAKEKENAAKEAKDKVQKVEVVEKKKDDVSKALEVDLIKGGKYPVGTIRTYKDGKKYKKEGEGKWVLVKDSKKKNSEESVVEGSLDLSNFYSTGTKKVAEKRAAKEGKIAVRFQGRYWVVDQATYDQMNGVGNPKKAEDVKPQKQSKNTVEEWTSWWNEKSRKDLAETMEKDMDTMSLEKFVGLVNADWFNGTMLDMVDDAVDKDSAVNKMQMKNAIRDVADAIARGYNSETKDNNSDLHEDYKDMSRAEKALIWAYTNTSYKSINRLLSGKQKYEPPKFAKALIEKASELTSKALDSVKDTTTGNTVFRGYKSSTRVWGDYKEKMTEAFMNIGSEMSFGTLLSTSREPAGMLHASSEHAIVYEIIRKTDGSSKGKSIREISKFRSEDEVIFSPNARFKIRKVIKNDSKSSMTITAKGGASPNQTTGYLARSVIVLEEI